MGPELILPMLAAVHWPIGFLVLGGLLKRPAPVVGHASKEDQTDAPQSLSIIIPARNEERNLPILLESLANQSVRPSELIVVDDGSTDGTADAARRFGATVLASTPLPEGWRGKTWACWQGAIAARGRRMLFVDADTWFGPDGLAGILGNDPASVVSVGPYHDVRRPYEQLSAFFNLIMSAGTGAFRLPAQRPNGLFGQCLLVDREDYFQAGGHEAVKGEVLENFLLADRFREHGVPLVCRPGGRNLYFRMYPEGVAQVIEGWTKGFAKGAGRTPLGLRLLIFLWIGGMCFSLSACWFGWAGVLAYLLYAGQIWLLLRRIGAFRWYTAALFPIPLAFFFLVFTRSTLRAGKEVSWKGRVFRAH